MEIGPLQVVQHLKDPLVATVEQRSFSLAAHLTFQLLCSLSGTTSYDSILVQTLSDQTSQLLAHIYFPINRRA